MEIETFEYFKLYLFISKNSDDGEVARLLL